MSRLLTNFKSIGAFRHALSPKTLIGQRALSILIRGPREVSRPSLGYANAFPSLLVSRSLSENAAAASSEAPPAPVSQASDNVLGQAYHDLVYRGRGGLPLSLGDLRSLLLLCITESSSFITKDNEKAKKCRNYIIFATKLYQDKGHDFSEETNSLFIKAMLTSTASNNEMQKETIQIIINILGKYKNRIGSWSTAKSIHTLVTAIIDTKLSFSSSASTSANAEYAEYAEVDGESDDNRSESDWDSDVVVMLVSMLDTVTKKGVYLSPETLTTVTELVNQIPDDIIAAVEGGDTDGDGDNADDGDEEEGYTAPIEKGKKAVCMEKMAGLTTRVA